MLVAGPDDSDGMEAFNGGAATPFLSRTPQIAMTTAGGESLRTESARQQQYVCWADQ